MTSLRGMGPPAGDSGAGDPYATWDAAYVLGSLSAADRREFEAHLATCPACRDAVADFSGVPALLSQLDHAEVVAMDAGDDTVAAAPQPSPELLTTLLATVRWRRRRTQLTTWVASTAAAVVLGIGVFVGVHGVQALVEVPGGHGHSAAVAAPQPMAQIGTKMLASTVSLSSEHWGTFINLKCECLAPVNSHHDTLAMVVVGRDGSQTRLATWVAEPGHTATPAGSISTPVNEIASVQVVSADTGQVLLERSL